MAQLLLIKEFLKGKKTYIIAVLMIGLGLLQGDNNLVMEGIAFATVRGGMDKIKK